MRSIYRDDMTVCEEQNKPVNPMCSQSIIQQDKEVFVVVMRYRSAMKFDCRLPNGCGLLSQQSIATRMHEHTRTIIANVVSHTRNLDTYMQAMGSASPTTSSSLKGTHACPLKLRPVPVSAAE
jgi:hypothetical protein